MRNQIVEDLKTAMKKQDKETLLVVRMIKGAIQMEELNTKKELTDDEVITIVTKQIKTRKESIVEFEKGNRQDLIDQTNSEITILEKYLPEQLTEAEVIKIIDQAFDKVKPESMRDMGKLMGLITPAVKGKYDMGEISKIIKIKLGCN